MCLSVGRVNQNEFHVHRAILGSQSPVFDAMFQADTFKESKEGRVEIPDIDADVFEQLLAWIYTGKVDIERTFALELLVAADKVNIFGYYFFWTLIGSIISFSINWSY